MKNKGHFPATSDTMQFGVDISENLLLSWGNDILSTLLKDHTTGRNIIWATDDYRHLGDGYGFFDEITIEKITGDNGQDKIIRPRISKSQDEQRRRAKDKAEVFTPSWVCNAQNNLIDEAWFGRNDVFNHENDDHTWTTNHDKIEFPEGKTWKDYVRDTRMEITCGEAPYLVSRYDTTTGAVFEDINDRIGLLDRKLRIVSENAPVEKRDQAAAWRGWAIKAYQSTYAFEWQGDNLLLAREALLVSYIDFYKARCGKTPKVTALRKIAEIISWNIWQMDGLTYGIPGHTPKEILGNVVLSDEIAPEERFCRIMEWTSYEPLQGEEIIFAEILKNK